MTPQEWAAHRTAIHRLAPVEREAYRAAHHEEMKKRADAQGLALPDEPLLAGAGRGGPGGWAGPVFRGRGRPPCRSR